MKPLMVFRNDGHSAPVGRVDDQRLTLVVLALPLALGGVEGGLDVGPLAWSRDLAWVDRGLELGRVRPWPAGGRGPAEERA